MTGIEVPEEKASIPKLKRMNKTLDAVYRQVMQEGTDYDTLPGMTKPILLKSGAELLARHFELVADTQIVGSIERIDQAIPYFQYRAECRLYNSEGEFVGNGVGTCNTAEPEYKDMWVSLDEIPSSIKSPEDLQTKDVDGTKLYGVPISREKAFGLANTVMKKAEKRAFVNAVLRVTGSSRIFTQDIGVEKDDGDAKG